ncbi:hypothetical protein MMC30_009417 [Trapelia coarctata]|nr:hypothetical protein [Trapelia coarctata]
MYLHALLISALFALTTLTTSRPVTETEANSVSLPANLDVLAIPSANFTATNNLTRRETLIGAPANLILWVFTTTDCTGTIANFPDIAYSTGYILNWPFQSYMLNRDMAVREQLDFSGPPNCDNFLAWTADLHHSLCYPLGRPVTCARFWHY